MAEIVARRTSTPSLRAETRDRRRSVLHLIYEYLREHRLTATAQALLAESTEVSPEEYRVCENVDLEIVLQEYQSYYRTKFQKEPRILRRVDAAEKAAVAAARPRRRSGAAQKARGGPAPTSDDGEDFHFEVVSLGEASGARAPPPAAPLCLGDYPEEYKETAEHVLRQAVAPDAAATSWDDCVGLEAAVEKLKEAVVYPALYPEYFRGVDTWRGILLYGPPGTGKTTLARAAVRASNGRFFNVTAAGIVSKWRGESEKTVMVLFDVARRNAPSTIFIDEIDALACVADDHHGAARRLRSELLTQMDGLPSTAQPVLVLASTNRPWDLDAALLRRFERRVRVPPPDERARLAILRRRLAGLVGDADADELRRVARDSMAGFTGAEVGVACKAVAVAAAARRARDAERGAAAARAPPRVTVDDVRRAAAATKPCCADYARYEEWERKYGCP